VARLSGLLGFTRQAYYQHFWSQQQMSKEHQLVLEQVRSIRGNNPGMGTRKLLIVLQDFLMGHGIKIGRDALFDLLATNHLLIRKRRRRIHTTNSGHWLKRYPNLIREIKINRINQIWVSDITYLKTQEGYVYISMITDAYSRKIVGYNLADNLETVNALQALKMAIINARKQGVSLEGLIHHSDQGFQYCSNPYVTTLKKQGINISMSDKGDPLQNAIAERINGIIKHEYLFYRDLKDKYTTRQILEESIHAYNTQRPHLSCSLLTPEQAHLLNQPLNKLWKNYYNKQPETVNQFQD
jgi:transposase InsO family protein